MMLQRLQRRATDAEMLDEGVPAAAALRNLADIRRINRWAAGRRRFVSTVRGLVDRCGKPSILDVGCGSADLALACLRACGDETRVVGVDRKLLHLRQAPSEVLRVAADARQLPFAARTFDVVTASLFLHHFGDPEVPRMLGELYALSRCALVVFDLERSTIPFLLARFALPLVFRSRVTRHDGLVSVRRGFRLSELQDAFLRAGIPHVRVTRVFPYRLLAVAQRAAGPADGPLSNIGA